MNGIEPRVEPTTPRKTLPAIRESMENISIDDAIQFSAVDGVFYGHYFFPKTFKQSSPRYAPLLNYSLECLHDPFHAFEIFRGGAKTTVTRVAISKRFAFNIAKLALAVGASQAHSKRTVRWLRRQVENNRIWAEAFGLYPGQPWTDEEITLIHKSPGGEGILDYSHLLAYGITAKHRGINIDDHRPDFIFADDPCDEESTGTDDQRKKTAALFFGSLQRSLVPLTENPYAKFLLLQTGLHREDLIHRCHRDAMWTTYKIPVFDSNGESIWPDRLPTQQLLKEKRGYIANGDIHLWMREMECRIVSATGAAFNPDTFNFYDLLPTQMTTFIGIDPASEKAKPKTAHKAAMVCIGISKGEVYLLDYWAQKNKNPEEIWTEFYRMALRWRPRRVGIETVAYQQILEWYFRQKMKANNFYVQIHEIQDRRSKADRIRQALSGRIQQGTFKMRREHTDFVTALYDYTDGVDIDVLDACAMAVDTAFPSLIQEGENDWIDAEDYEDDEPIEVVAKCP